MASSSPNPHLPSLAFRADCGFGTCPEGRAWRGEGRVYGLDIMVAGMGVYEGRDEEDEEESSGIGR